jgi:phosphatidylserine decarboxylase
METRPAPTHVFPPPGEDPIERTRWIVFGWWEVRRASIVAAASGILGAALALAFRQPLCLLLWAPGAALLGTALFFFRNPRRTIPSGRGVIVAPADGIIAALAEADEPEFIRGRALCIRIAIALTNVHINRAPCGGIVRFRAHRPGAAEGPETMRVGLEREDEGGPRAVRVLLTQIACRTTGRLVCRVRPGDRLWRGGILGMIKFGSRVELHIERRHDARFVPAVAAGARVRAGSTVLGTLEAAHASESSDAR